MSGPSKPLLSKNVFDEIYRAFFILCLNPLYESRLFALLHPKCLLGWRNGLADKPHKCEDLSLDL